MTWKPHVTVAALVQDDSKFLMVEEIINNIAVINQPAGHLEPGESLLQAVVRETLEETGRHFTPGSLTGIYQWTHPDSQQHFLRFCFSGKIDYFDPSYELDSDINQVLWLTQEEISSDQHTIRSPLVVKSMLDYINGHRYPLEALDYLSESI